MLEVVEEALLDEEIVEISDDDSVSNEKLNENKYDGDDDGGDDVYLVLAGVGSQIWVVVKAWGGEGLHVYSCSCFFDLSFKY